MISWAGDTIQPLTQAKPGVIRNLMTRVGDPRTSRVKEELSRPPGACGWQTALGAEVLRAGDVLAFLFILFPKPLCASRNRQQGVLEALLRGSQLQSQEKKARPLSHRVAPTLAVVSAPHPPHRQFSKLGARPPRAWSQRRLEGHGTLFQRETTTSGIERRLDPLTLQLKTLKGPPSPLAPSPNS